MVPPKMVNFAPKRNATYMSGTHFPTLLSFLPILPQSVRTVVRAYADVITKVSGIDRFSVCIPSHDTYGAPLRAARCTRGRSAINDRVHWLVSIRITRFAHEKQGVF